MFKVPNCRVLRISISRIAVLVLGRYLLVEYLDPWGSELRGEEVL